MSKQQQHTRRFLFSLHFSNPSLLRIELLLITLQQLRGLSLCAEQLGQMSNVFLQRWQIWLSRKQRHLNPGRFYLRQYRWRAHFFGADQDIRAQTENALSGQTALITNTR
ncbi:hypothetical protein D3C72_656160 [compost metagenome]